MTQAVILAGGLGTRLRSVVADVPKPMAPVSGRPFLEHLMDYWIAQGIKGFVLSVGHLGEVIRAHFGSTYREVPVKYSVEKDLLGTGGGLLQAIAGLPGESPYVVMNGDTFFEVRLAELRQCQETLRADVVVSLLEIEENSRYGSVRLGEDGQVAEFGRPADGARGLINGGVYLFGKGALSEAVAAFDGKPCSLERDLFPEMIRRGLAIRAHVIHATDERRFIDIGIPEDYEMAESALEVRG